MTAPEPVTDIDGVLADIAHHAHALGEAFHRLGEMVAENPDVLDVPLQPDVVDVPAYKLKAWDMVERWYGGRPFYRRIRKIERPIGESEQHKQLRVTFTPINGADYETVEKFNPWQTVTIAADPNAADRWNANESFGEVTR